jgi:hypothetical protein
MLRADRSRSACWSARSPDRLGAYGHSANKSVPLAGGSNRQAIAQSQSMPSHMPCIARGSASRRRSQRNRSAGSNLIGWATPLPSVTGASLTGVGCNLTHIGCIVVGLVLELFALRTAAASLAFFVNFLVELMLLVGLSQQALFEFRFFEIPTRVRKGRCHRQRAGCQDDCREGGCEEGSDVDVGPTCHGPAPYVGCFDWESIATRSRTPV